MPQYLCLFSLILQGLHKEGECRQLEFWAGKGANIRDLFCTTPKSWNSTEHLIINNEKSSPKMKTRGTTPFSRGWGRPPLGCAPYLVGPLVAVRCPSSAIWSLSSEKKYKKAFGTRLRRHEAEPWRNKSRAPVELFCRGNFPPGGGNHRHRHHQRSSHRERAISINIFISTISSQNPSSSLVSNSCL